MISVSMGTAAVLSMSASDDAFGVLSGVTGDVVFEAERAFSSVSRTCSGLTRKLEIKLWPEGENGEINNG